MHLTPAAALSVALVLVGACAHAPAERRDAGAHLSPPRDRDEIPAIAHPPLVVPPVPEAKTELYTVEVRDVPVRELLFTLAHDARLNLDLSPEVTGRITLSLVDQPLPQIVHRIAGHARLRYQLTDRTLLVAPDKPYLRSYRVDYVNMARKATSAVSVVTEIGTTGVGAVSGGARSGANLSTTTLEQQSTNQLWETLIANIRALVGGSEGNLLVNRESGIVTLRATQAQHEEVQALLDTALARARQQVLIEATVVEVELSDQFQSGVDWSMLDEKNGIGISQQLTATNLAAAPVTTLTIDNASNNLLVTIKMLEQFGNLKVLSSPKVMALNNQTALLKVVDNRVYFTVTVDIQAGTASSPGMTVYSSTVHTVPVGFVMAVTPQVSDDDSVTMNVRPTISRVLDYVRDPNPALAQAKVISQVPEIQVREIESVLQVASGQIAVLGGLMQDTVDNKRSAVPLLSELPLLGDLFSYRDERARKTELVIFLRPSVIRDASIDGELRDYRRFLPGSDFSTD